MSNYQIGKVIGVSGDEIFVALIDHEEVAGPLCQNSCRVPQMNS